MGFFLVVLVFSQSQLIINVGALVKIKMPFGVNADPRRITVATMSAIRDDDMR